LRGPELRQRTGDSRQRAAQLIRCRIVRRFAADRAAGMNGEAEEFVT